MITALAELPPESQAMVLDFVEFLKARQAWQHAGSTKDLFAESTFEDPDAPSVYKGPLLTLDHGDTEQSLKNKVARASSPG